MANMGCVQVRLLLLEPTYYTFAYNYLELQSKGSLNHPKKGTFRIARENQNLQISDTRDLLMILMKVNPQVTQVITFLKNPDVKFLVAKSFQLGRSSCSLFHVQAFPNLPFPPISSAILSQNFFLFPRDGFPEIS